MAIANIGKVGNVLNTPLRIDANFYRMITAAFRAIIRVTEIKGNAIRRIDFAGFNFLVNNGYQLIADSDTPAANKSACSGPKPVWPPSPSQPAARLTPLTTTPAANIAVRSTLSARFKLVSIFFSVAARRGLVWHQSAFPD